MYKTKSFLLISLLKFGLFRILSKITNYTMKKNQSQSQCWYANIRANKRIYFITFILQWNVIQWYYWNFIEILKLIYNRLISKQECFIRYNLLLCIYLTNKSKYPKKSTWIYHKSLEDNPAFHARSKQTTRGSWTNINSTLFS